MLTVTQDLTEGRWMAGTVADQNQLVYFSVPTRGEAVRVNGNELKCIYAVNDR